MDTSPTPNNEDDLPPEDDDLKEAGALFDAYAEAVEKEDVDEEVDAILKIWQHVRENPQKPSPWLMAMSEAHTCEASFDWLGAEAAYKRAIEGAADRPMLQTNALGQLCSLYCLLEKYELAREAAMTATEAARQGPSPVILISKLQTEAGFHLSARETDLARTKINEALSLVEDGPMWNLSQAGCLILRASCAIEEGNLESAQQDLVEAWSLLESHAEIDFLAGCQSEIGAWWEVKAKVHEAREEWEEAALAFAEVVERRRIISQLPQLEGPYKFNSLAVALRALYRAKIRAGDSSASLDMEESHAIRRRIGLPLLEE